MLRRSCGLLGPKSEFCFIKFRYKDSNSNAKANILFESVEENRANSINLDLTIDVKGLSYSMLRKLSAQDKLSERRKT